MQRSIVPRPLPFGPATSTALTLPLSAPSAPAVPPNHHQRQPPLPAAGASRNPSLVQQQLVTLLQTLVLQQKQRRQQQQQQQRQNTTVSAASQEGQQDLSTAISRKAEEILQMQSSLPRSVSSALPPPSTAPGTTPAITTATVVAEPDIPEGDIQAAILDNLFTTHTSGSDGPSSSSRLFHTSSDTVDQLLRGLNTRSQSESIQKLSQDTAGVLPNFARALESFIGLPPSSSSVSPTPPPLSPTPLSYPSSGGRVADDGLVGTREDNELSPTALSGKCVLYKYCRLRTSLCILSMLAVHFLVGWHFFCTSKSTT